jgi:hypothetical protein
MRLVSVELLYITSVLLSYRLSLGSHKLKGQFWAAWTIYACVQTPGLSGSNKELYEWVGDHEVAHLHSNVT